VIEVDPDFSYRSLFATFDASQALDPAKQAHARLLDSPYILFTQIPTTRGVRYREHH
jgi:hypothetical protein